jgi:hypothetical protein
MCSIPPSGSKFNSLSIYLSLYLSIGSVYVVTLRYHGKGKFRWATGAKYDGDWWKGKRTGKGTLKSADGYVVIVLLLLSLFLFL